MACMIPYVGGWGGVHRQAVGAASCPLAAAAMLLAPRTPSAGGPWQDEAVGRQARGLERLTAAGGGENERFFNVKRWPGNERIKRRRRDTVRCGHVTGAAGRSASHGAQANSQVNAATVQSENSWSHSLVLGEVFELTTQRLTPR
jgi:hypothetical protein